MFIGDLFSCSFFGVCLCSFEVVLLLSCKYLSVYFEYCFCLGWRFCNGFSFYFGNVLVIVYYLQYGYLRCGVGVGILCCCCRLYGDIYLIKINCVFI